MEEEGSRTTHLLNSPPDGREGGERKGGFRPFFLTGREQHGKEGKVATSSLLFPFRGREMERRGGEKEMLNH